MRRLGGRHARGPGRRGPRRGAQDPHDSDGDPPRARRSRRPLPLPRLHGAPLRRPPHRALGRRRRDGARQPGAAVPASPPAGARGRLARRTDREEKRRSFDPTVVRSFAAPASSSGGRADRGQCVPAPDRCAAGTARDSTSATRSTCCGASIASAPCANRRGRAYSCARAVRRSPERQHVRQHDLNAVAEHAQPESSPRRHGVTLSSGRLRSRSTNATRAARCIRLPTTISRDRGDAAELVATRVGPVSRRQIRSRAVTTSRAGDRASSTRAGNRRSGLICGATHVTAHTAASTPATTAGTRS